MRQTPHCVRIDGLSSLACLTSVCSDHLPSCSLWRRHCSLAPDAICLSHSVNSSALSYTVRILCRNPLHRTLKNFSTCANLKCTLPSFLFVQLKFSVYGHTQTDRHTHASCNAVTLVWGLLRLFPITVTEW